MSYRSVKLHVLLRLETWIRHFVEWIIFVKMYGICVMPVSTTSANFLVLSLLNIFFDHYIPFKWSYSYDEDVRVSIDFQIKKKLLFLFNQWFYLFIYFGNLGVFPGRWFHLFLLFTQLIYLMDIFLCEKIIQENIRRETILLQSLRLGFYFFRLSYYYYILVIFSVFSYRQI